jgi:hypothetical protein
MLAAAEAAHWDRQDTRAKILANRARRLAIKFEFLAKHDEDREFALAGDKDEADSDLAGRWTLGVRP